MDEIEVEIIDKLTLKVTDINKESLCFWLIDGEVKFGEC